MNHTVSGFRRLPTSRATTIWYSSLRSLASSNMNAYPPWRNLLILCSLFTRIALLLPTLAGAFVPSNIHRTYHGYLSQPITDGTSRLYVLKQPQSGEISLERRKKREEVVATFVSNVQESIDNDSFLSLTVRGVKRSKTDDVASLRGCIRLIQGRLIEVQSNGKMLQLSIKYHGATDIFKNWKLEDVASLLPQLILDPSGMMTSEWGEAAVQAKPLRGAELKTAQSLWDLQLSSKKPKLIQRRQTSTTDSDPTSLVHDRTKQVPLSNQADFLQALGVTSADGKPRPGMKSKLRQCQKFVEIVGGLVKKAPTHSETDTSSKAISVVDMGCGRGYLTFSLHSYLSEHYHHVESTGIDVRPKLVQEISEIAESLGDDFKTLTFEEGTIEDAAEGATVQESGSLNATSESGVLDILIALHACDTATDDAIWSGICRGADIIVVAPCCHKQIRSQLNSHYAAHSRTHPMADVLRHGVYRERLSETVTDSLRALLLEREGYKVQVFEFIGGEHTSKNVMITAVKCNPVQDLEDVDVRIQSLASFHGIRKQKLAEWMGMQLIDGPGGDATSNTQLSVHRMPPHKRI